MEEIIKRVRKRHPSLCEKEILRIAEVIRYHDGNSEILSREIFEKEIEKRMVKDRVFHCWTIKHTEFFIYQNCIKARWV